MTQSAGISVMLSDDSSSVKAYQEALNKTISQIKFENDSLKLYFTDGTGILIFDDGQSFGTVYGGCEHRYMTTDDDLDSFTKAVFLGLELLDAPTIEDEDSDPHEVQFLKVSTSNGVFTIETHNEHNGYYGGFFVKVEQINFVQPSILLTEKDQQCSPK